MDDSSPFDLEAELGCFQVDPINVAPRVDHGSSDTFFEAPAEDCVHLTPPSKTKSAYPFGSNGTIAWATPAGELLQILTCIDNKLVAIEYKRSIERGQEYSDRGKMLEQAVNSTQGLGFGIGISLGVEIEPYHVTWLHNRWPRYSFKHEGLDIRLQYQIEAQAVVQQYQIRNNGSSEVVFPYTTSSDVCIREHDSNFRPPHPIQTGKSSNRLFLYQNTKVVIRNPAIKGDFNMTMFLNAQRQTLWAEGPERSSKQHDGNGNLPFNTGSSDYEVKVETQEQRDLEGVKEIEKEIKKGLADGKYPYEVDTRQHRRAFRWAYFRGPTMKNASGGQYDFAKYQCHLHIPPGSTQELCAVLQISDPKESHEHIGQTSEERDDNEGTDEPGIIRKGHDRVNRKIEQGQRRLALKAANISLAKADNKRKSQASELIQRHVQLAGACAKTHQISEARYHHFMSCQVAEVVNELGKFLLCDTQYRYAEFLRAQGWIDDAFDVFLRLNQRLSGISIPPEDIATANIRYNIEVRLASMYAEKAEFAAAESLYLSLLESGKHRINADSTAAFLLGNIAWLQVRQDKLDAAYVNYSRLEQHESANRPLILSNMAFVKRRLRQFQEAKVLYELALGVCGDESSNPIGAQTLQSGLFSCLRELGANPNTALDLSPANTNYVDLNTLLKSTSYKGTLFDNTSPLDFALSRHLESLLSICSVPVNMNSKLEGVAFVDADILESMYDARYAYYQFKFLIQCQRRHSTEHGSSQQHSDTMARILRSCRAHVIWIFQIVRFDDTWEEYYTVDGTPAPPRHRKISGESGLSRSVEGAYQFLKLCLFFDAWKDEWELVLELLSLRLAGWLSYLQSTQHMGNLWIQEEDIETLKPRDTRSQDSDPVRRRFPHYYLADSALLWLAIRQVERLLQSLDDICYQCSGERKSAKEAVKHLRQSVGSYTKAVGPQTIRSNILNTFKIARRDSISPVLASDQDLSSPTGKTAEKLQMFVPAISDENASAVAGHSSAKPITKLGPSISGADQQIIACQRSVNEYMCEIEPSDGPIIEAIFGGLLQATSGNMNAAWQETLKIQGRKDVSSMHEARQLAFALWTSRFDYKLAQCKEGDPHDALCNRLSASLYSSGAFAEEIKDEAPAPMLSWASPTYETANLIMGCRYDGCRLAFSSVNQAEHQLMSDASQEQPPRRASVISQRKFEILMPGAVDSSTRLNQKNVVDTAFIPGWMYHYPDFIHKKSLSINAAEKLPELSNIQSLRSEIALWKDGNCPSGPVFPHSPFWPAIVDAGAKQQNADWKSEDRYMKTGSYNRRHEFLDRLLEPRTADKAKKRLIEVFGGDKRSIIICWLTAPEPERSFLTDFYERHTGAESFFAERVDWKGNIWDTELHIGFFQILDDDWDTSSRSRKATRIPNLSRTSPHQSIVRVAMSFRFVGDLRDRFWTCLFLSSDARYASFKGLFDEYRGTWKRSARDFYVEKLAQRKILETVYVERALREMITSLDRILTAFKKEFDVHEVKDRQMNQLDVMHESFEFIYQYSSLHLKAGEILRDILEQLNVSISTIEEWEKREDTRGLRSRWSQKDEERYGERLRSLMRICKIHTQQLRMQQSRLAEQRRFAEQRHNYLVSYMQLREARTSTRSAADVRLFTFVTIVFLPLSFSSSLFSMQGAPTSSTIAVMVQTTVIALAITILILSNLRLMDRNWSFWLNRMNTYARKKMKTGRYAWISNWGRIAAELDEAAQREVTKSRTEENLPAESKWYYFWFWLSYLFKVPRLCVIEALDSLITQRRISHFPYVLGSVRALILAPVCALISITQLLFITLYDVVGLTAALLRDLTTKMLDLPEDTTPNEARKKRRMQREKRKAAYDDSSSITSTIRSDDFFDYSFHGGYLGFSYDWKHMVISWLRAPPRPIKDLKRRRIGTRLRTEETSWMISESDSDGRLSSIHDDELTSEKEDEKKSETGTTSSSDKATESHHEDTRDLPRRSTSSVVSIKETGPWWKAPFRRRHTRDSTV